MMACPSNDGVHYEKGPPVADLMKFDPVIAERVLREQFSRFEALYPVAMAFREQMVAKAEEVASRIGKRCVVLRTTRVVTC